MIRWHPRQGLVSCDRCGLEELTEQSEEFWDRWAMQWPAVIAPVDGSGWPRPAIEAEPCPEPLTICEGCLTVAEQASLERARDLLGRAEEGDEER